MRDLVRYPLGDLNPVRHGDARRPARPRALHTLTGGAVASRPPDPARALDSRPAPVPACARRVEGGCRGVAGADRRRVRAVAGSRGGGAGGCPRGRPRQAAEARRQSPRLDGVAPDASAGRSDRRPLGETDLWTRDGWHRKFGRPPDHEDSGYGHTAAQVAAFRSPSAKVQIDYLKATTEQTKEYLAALTPADLDRELDEAWYTPRPTVGVRLLSILADCHQHAGEAAYIRGLVKSRARASRPPRPQRRARPAKRKRPARSAAADLRPRRRAASDVSRVRKLVP